MFIYIHVLSYYQLLLYFYLCLCVQLDRLSCSFTSMSFLTTSCSLTFTCVYVYNWIVSHVHLHQCHFLLQAVPLLLSVSKCTLGSSLMFIYIHVLSYNRLFLYFYLCLCVQLNRLSCSFTSIWLLANTIQCNTTTQTNRMHSMYYHTIKYCAMINKHNKKQLLKINAKLVWSRALSSDLKTVQQKHFLLGLGFTWNK